MRQNMNDSLFDSDIEELRERTIDSLTEAYSQDLLTTSEFEKRVSTANFADSTRELRSILADVPIEAAGHGARGGPGERGEAAPRPAESGSDETVYAILGSRTYAPATTGPTPSTAVTFLGSLVIDLTELEPQRSAHAINVVSVMGDVKIIVPADGRVENRMVSLLADLKDTSGGGGKRDGGTRGGGRRGLGIRRNRQRDTGPTIRLQGLCLMSDVKIVSE
jgi:hypothetical protein